MYELHPNEIVLKPPRRPGVRWPELTYVVRRPTDEDWYQYDYYYLPLSITRAEALDMPTNEIEACKIVFDRICVRVEGQLNGRPIMEDPDWLSKIPDLEKRRVVRTFSEVQAVELSEEDHENLNRCAPPLRYFVKLLAGLGGNLYYCYYGFPDISGRHLREYQRQAQMWKTKFEGNRVVLERQLTLKRLANLCRDLVQWVAGYTWQGRELMEFEDWKQKLDALHCKVAVDRLFAMVQEDFEENFPSSDPLASRFSKASHRTTKATSEE
jgi:hypothetical protein